MSRPARNKCQCPCAAGRPACIMKATGRGRPAAAKWEDHDMKTSREYCPACQYRSFYDCLKQLRLSPEEEERLIRWYLKEAAERFDFTLTPGKNHFYSRPIHEYAGYDFYAGQKRKDNEEMLRYEEHAKKAVLAAKKRVGSGGALRHCRQRHRPHGPPRHHRGTGAGRRGAKAFGHRRRRAAARGAAEGPQRSLRDRQLRRAGVRQGLFVGDGRPGPWRRFPNSPWRCGAAPLPTTP